MKNLELVDLSAKQELAIACMNLISIEEHLQFTHNKTKKPEYLEIAAAVREVRKKYLKKLVGAPEGELWCVSKHLLSATMRMMESGTKFLKLNKNEGLEMFADSHELWKLFWFLQKNFCENRRINVGKSATTERLRWKNADGKSRKKT